ncbi:LacI family DNA-binding transcriptional regulator [Salinibacterium sp. UTAS2018]|uniref:LacI family DNA-binding transcriptional regulator n=1 Tax=Salinibacterium sp. UTAS2018 TaxID=2508880 RepID=UPI001009479F|nr:LacI family DNA-binding transcriptional regulator [Salinibacterium sp. UTAS2018]QAV71047.1 LacI family DNA-binding transcriptional regulator [Salinibacterium sp. UTAS2018]
MESGSGVQSAKLRAPNIRDVARRAGVSYQTVSRVLNDSPNIRDSTRDRVREAINELGYRPNQAARTLVTSRTRTIGVLAQQSSHFGPATTIQAIELAAREASYRLSITNVASNDRHAIKAGLDYLMSQSVEAIVFVTPQGRALDAVRELSVSVPFVALHANQVDQSRHSMSVDQQAGARLATRHLIDLGHTEIMHLSGPRDWLEAEARVQGFLDEINEAGLKARAPVLGDWSSSFGYYAGLELLRSRDFTALFASNDQMALGFMHACRELGLSIPDDMSVVGFDDIPEAAHFFPPLTTVRQNLPEIGRRAISVLLAGLRGENPGDDGIVLPELIVRESTATL